MNPKISICIPAYKQPDYLKRALVSVLQQSFNDYEVIITDDSPDNSVQNIVNDFKDNRIKYYKNSEVKGSPENWNVCLDLAKGEYIKFLHHDDWFFDKDSLQKFIEILDNNQEADFAFCASYNYTPDGNLKFLHSPDDTKFSKLRKNPSYLFPENIIGAPSATIYRRKLDFRFDKNLKWVVDIDFYIRLLKQNTNFIYSSEPLISITTDAEHQVTHECQNDKNIQVFEWIYLYKKIENDSNIGYKHFKFICRLINKYNILSEKELLSLGIEKPIPNLVQTAILLNKLPGFGYLLKL